MTPTSADTTIPTIRAAQTVQKKLVVPILSNGLIGQNRNQKIAERAYHRRSGALPVSVKFSKKSKPGTRSGRVSSRIPQRTSCQLPSVGYIPLPLRCASKFHLDD